MKPEKSNILFRLHSIWAIAVIVALHVGWTGSVVSAEINPGLRLIVPQGESVIRASAAGSIFEKKVSGTGGQDVLLGKISVKAAGYVRVDLQGLKKTGPVSAEVAELLVRSAEADLKPDCVKDAANNMFYWGRRGPSVHLNYHVPSGRDIRYAYSELTVPDGQHPAGYFLANIRLENVNPGREELLNLNMDRQIIIGELLHAETAYIHEHRVHITNLSILLRDYRGTSGDDPHAPESILC